MKRSDSRSKNKCLKELIWVNFGTMLDTSLSKKILNNAGIAAISGAGRARTDDDGIMSSGL